MKFGGEKGRIAIIGVMGFIFVIGLLLIKTTEYLGIDLPQLPLVLSAPQWLEEQALADGAFGLALGLPLHLALPPFITGSKVVTEVLTESLKDITGGHVIVNQDPKSSADQLEEIIIDRRQKLGLKEVEIYA